MLWPFGFLQQSAAAIVSAHFTRRLVELSSSPIALHTEAANAQHYELPTAFFELRLGPRLKYSACYYPRGDETLAVAPRIASLKMLPDEVVASPRMLPATGTGTMPPPLSRRGYGHQDDTYGAG